MDEKDHDLLIRIDERTASMQMQWSSLVPTFVTKKEFLPIRNFVYSLIGLVLVAVFGAILKLIL